MTVLAAPQCCPNCSTPMQLVVSERYRHCAVCARSPNGVLVYVPVGDAPPHPMHGARFEAMPVPTEPPKPRPAARRPVRRRQRKGAAR